MKLLSTLILWIGISVTGHAAVILQYHHISNATPASTSLAPELFRAHMAYIEELGYDVIPLSELVAALNNGTEVPDNAVVITFDDGYADNYAPIVEELHSRNWPYTIFVPPQIIDDQVRGYLSWDQIRELAEHGAEISNHSQGHEHLAAKLDGETDDEWLSRVQANILSAEQRIEEQTGQSHRILAYPYGEFAPEILSMLADLDFAAVGQHSGAVDHFSNVQALPRFPFGGAYGGMSGFRTKVRTKAMPVTEFQLSSNGERLPSHILTHDQSWPSLTLLLDHEGPVKASSLNCFASGLGAQEVEALDDYTLVTSPEGYLSVGRSRYNCTAPTGERGRFFWYSVPIIRLDEGDQWPPEF